MLIVEFANKMQERERGKLDAVREASLMRLRPVSPTSLGTVAGHFPLTFVEGSGAAARNSIRVVLVQGRARRRMTIRPADESHPSARETTERGGARRDDVARRRRRCREGTGGTVSSLCERNPLLVSSGLFAFTLELFSGTRTLG